MSDKCPQNFVQVVGQMSVSDKCPCRTNVRLPSVRDIRTIDFVVYAYLSYKVGFIQKY